MRCPHIRSHLQLLGPQVTYSPRSDLALRSEYSHAHPFPFSGSHCPGKQFTATSLLGRMHTRAADRKRWIGRGARWCAAAVARSSRTAVQHLHMCTHLEALQIPPFRSVSFDSFKGFSLYLLSSVILPWCAQVWFSLVFFLSWNFSNQYIKLWIFEKNQGS